MTERRREERRFKDERDRRREDKVLKCANGEKMISFGQRSDDGRENVLPEIRTKYNNGSGLPGFSYLFLQGSSCVDRGLGPLARSNATLVLHYTVLGL